MERLEILLRQPRHVQGQPTAQPRDGVVGRTTTQVLPGEGHHAGRQIGVVAADSVETDQLHIGREAGRVGMAAESEDAVEVVPLELEVARIVEVPEAPALDDRPSGGRWCS